MNGGTIIEVVLGLLLFGLFAALIVPPSQGRKFSPSDVGSQAGV